MSEEQKHHYYAAVRHGKRVALLAGPYGSREEAGKVLDLAVETYVERSRDFYVEMYDRGVVRTDVRRESKLGIIGRETAMDDDVPTPEEFNRLLIEKQDDAAQRPLHETGVRYTDVNTRDLLAEGRQIAGQPERPREYNPGAQVRPARNDHDKGPTR